MKTINITTMKHIVYILSIACLLVLSTKQAQAVDYKPYTGSSCVNQRMDAAAAPTIGFTSTSAYATDDWTNPTTPMLNADGSVSAGAYMGTGPRKAPPGNTTTGTGTPGGTLNPNDQQPLGDALLPLLACALLYILARRRKSAI